MIRLARTNGQALGLAANAMAELAKLAGLEELK